jgi:hypothetical protein
LLAVIGRHGARQETKRHNLARVFCIGLLGSRQYAETGIGFVWVEQLLRRAHPNAVAVALANNIARIARVLLVRNQTSCPARTL